MIKILFICHGNICRSPMAEFILKHLVKNNARKDIYISSAATSTEEIGNDVYPPVKKLLYEKGIACKNHAARHLTKSDYDEYDYLITMDNANYRNTIRICGGDPDNKISMLTDYSDKSGEIEDPWYTRDFESCYKSILAGCEGLIKEL